MQPWKRAALYSVVLLGLTTGCGSGGGDTSPSGGVPSSAATASFDGTVVLSDFSATCREVTCWLPTQFSVALETGKTVSLRDKWPMDGMTVRVLCETTGQTYRDQTGQNTNAWYGILVPSDKLEPGAEAGAKKVSDGYLGYVGAAWIDGGAGKQAPAC